VRNYNYADSTGYVYNSVDDYSKTMERYVAYGGYQFNLNNIELKPYLSIGYFNSNIDKGSFTGIGMTGKLHLPYGANVFVSTEYDKTIGGKSKLNNTADKDVKDIWEVSAGVSKKIDFVEIYLKAYYREHKLDAVVSGDLGGGIIYRTTVDYKLKSTGLMIGLNF